MAEVVIMPKQGLQMTEGKINAWYAAEGDWVEEGKPLFEMETDKLNIEIDSPVSGTLLKIVRQIGEIVPITEIIAVVGQPGEDISGFLNAAAKPDAPAIDGIKAVNTASGDTKALINDVSKVEYGTNDRIFITPRARMAAQNAGINHEAVKGTGSDGLIIERDINAYLENTKALSKATPLAKKIAEQNEMEPGGIQGTGAGGKITKADVEAFATAGANKASAARTGKMIPFKGMRKVISDNMMKSLHGTAQANHRIKVDMTEVIRLREKLKTDGIKISYNDIIVKIVAKALVEIPVMNSSLTEDGILLKDYVSIGIAVTLENGLVVPVIKNADLLTLQEVAAVSEELIEKARNGGLSPDEYKGGTFTVTNLGMFDIDEFTAIINPPEAGILAIGKIDRIPVAVEDEIFIKPVMVLSLTYDHRIVDGAPAAEFLQRVKQIMQNPYLIM